MFQMGKMYLLRSPELAGVIVVLLNQASAFLGASAVAARKRMPSLALANDTQRPSNGYPSDDCPNQKIPAELLMA